jgi:hypothetical protein
MPDHGTILFTIHYSKSTKEREHSHLCRILATSAIYKELYGDEEGNYPATFQVSLTDDEEAYMATNTVF